MKCILKDRRTTRIVDITYRCEKTYRRKNVLAKKRIGEKTYRRKNVSTKKRIGLSIYSEHGQQIHILYL